MQVSVKLVKTDKLVYKDTSFKIMQVVVKIILRKKHHLKEFRSLRNIFYCQFRVIQKPNGNLGSTVCSHWNVNNLFEQYFLHDGDD